MLPVWAQPLKELPNKVQLPPALEQSVRALVALDEKDPTFPSSAASLADPLLSFLDDELTRLTEQRIALGDGNSLRQRLVADPRRQIDQVLSSLKARFQGERSEWTRRLQKQQAEVLDSVEAELKRLVLSTSVKGARGVTEVPESWRRTFVQWLDETLTTWGNHLGDLLPAKLKPALEPDLAALARLLGEPVTPRHARPSAITQTPARLELPELVDSAVVPTTMEAFFETFKNGLNTVAMLAGLVIIPVAGSFTDKQPTSLRAFVITSLVLPIVLFAIVQTRSQRKKLIGRLGEKAEEKLRKSLEQHSKTRVERYAKEADRHAGAWLQATQGDLIAELETQVASVFGRKEAGVAGELAKVAIQADRLQDQLSVVKQARSMVATSFGPEAKRRIAGR